MAVGNPVCGWLACMVTTATCPLTWTNLYGTFWDWNWYCQFAPYPNPGLVHLSSPVIRSVTLRAHPWLDPWVLTVTRFRRKNGRASTGSSMSIWLARAGYAPVAPSIALSFG